MSQKRPTSKLVEPEMADNQIVEYAGITCMVSPAVVVVGAWLLLWFHQGIRIAPGACVAIIWLLALVPVLAFVVSCLFMPSKYNIRTDLILYPLIMAFVGWNAGIVTVCLMRSPPKP